MSGGSETISPTAHYTGYVWARNGMSHPELETLEGRILFESLQPVMLAGSLIGRGTLEQYLLARHRAIDALLVRAIEKQGIRQVIEVAAGMSARGWRFVGRYPELSYVEGDLPGMVSRKRRALERMGSLGDRHRVVELDVLRSDGPASLPAVTARLDPGPGLAIITEGLLGYLPTASVEEIWTRFAAVLSGFPAGRYISDIHIGATQDMTVRAFRLLLSVFVRSRVHLHFDSPEDVVEALRVAGLAEARVCSAGAVVGGGGERGTRLAHILEASTR